MEGTDQNSIFARLNSIYGNLNGASPRSVKILKNNCQKKPVDKKCLYVDANNNAEKKEEDIGSDLQSENIIIKTCICKRPAKALECGRCHQYLHGRVATICEKHPVEAYLMDFRQCPYCLASAKVIKESEKTWAQIRQIEDAILSDSDL
ncbi:uncharacterized protein CG13380-like [Drosophila pseudoobscura]|uniref:Uncharacterized protein CG13380-like n=1 Tax=Drosophila pseudoobscura pseudoobscura TaxID=46245 RepID=A0A6I8V286_DROPS|nr:uncharacterized protein CG13380 [Drosophila pseudoobscura]